MKKAILVVASVFIFCVTSFALPIGQINPKAGSFSLGLDISIDKSDVVDKSDKTNKGDGKSNKYLLSGAYAFNDMVEAYLKLGMADLEYDPDGSPSVDLGSGFAWGLGVRGKYNFTNFYMAGDLQYFASSGHDGTESGIKYEADQDAIQLAVLIGKVIQNFDIYGGLKYSDLSIDADATGFGTTKFESDDNLGIFLGSSYNFTDQWSANLELRFIDETAFTLSGNFNF